MAILYPSIATIALLPQKPTEWEMNLIRFLNENLDDSYEIFFNPTVNGLKPDIIVYKKNHGVFIIEVKDYDLKLYSKLQNANWDVIIWDGDRIQKILSPFKQLEKYIETIQFFSSSVFADIQIQWRNDLKHRNHKNLSMLMLNSFIDSAVFFYNSQEDDFIKMDHKDRKKAFCDCEKLRQRIELSLQKKNGIMY